MILGNSENRYLSNQFIGDLFPADYPVASLPHYFRTMSSGIFIERGRVHTADQFYSSKRWSSNHYDSYIASTVDFWINVIDPLIDFSDYGKPDEAGVIDHTAVFITKDVRQSDDDWAGRSGAQNSKFYLPRS